MDVQQRNELSVGPEAQNISEEVIYKINLTSEAEFNSFITYIGGIFEVQHRQIEFSLEN